MIDRKEIQEAAASKFNPTVGGLANTTERIAFEKGVDWFKHRHLARSRRRANRRRFSSSTSFL